MNLITDDWRLKILAFGLAVLMLGGVAFSQNPPTQKLLKDVNIVYTVSPDIIVIDAPTKTNVTVTGLADTLTTVSSGNIAASFDLTNVAPGPNVHVNLSVRPLSGISGVQVQTPVVPYVLHIDKLMAKSIQVQLRPLRVSPGWSVTKSEAQCPGPTPCSVTFTGPASWEEGLIPYVEFPSSVQQNSQDAPSIPLQLVQTNGQPLDLSRQTVPAVKFEPTSVLIHVEAKPGTTLRQVVLISAGWTHGPAAGYRVTDITIEPVAVVMNGAPEDLAKITRITLAAQDLSGATSNKTFQVTIPYPAGITGTVAVAKVTYSISANPSVSPSP